MKTISIELYIFFCLKFRYYFAICVLSTTEYDNCRIIAIIECVSNNATYPAFTV